MNSLYLPSLTGEFGSWRYYQIIIPIKEIVKKNNDEYRIKLVEEVSEIYTQKNLNNMLQRVFDSKRLEPLKQYILKQKYKYINNLTVAIFDGDPEWLSINVSESSIMTLSKSRDDNYLDDIRKKFGIIKLRGDEVLFVLDGQHRVKALREAFNEDKNIGDDEISITLITHNNTTAGKKITRRLFTTINRYAKPVSLGENILLDEDDLSAIIARMLIEEYPLFKKNDVIALNKTADLKLPKDDTKFTSVIKLYHINEKLINPQDVYPPYIGSKNDIVRVRPSDDIINKYKRMIFDFWDIFFEIFDDAAIFINKQLPKYRERDIEPFYLRPIGQAIICEVYKFLKDNKKIDKFKNLKKIPHVLTNKFWHNVLINPQTNVILKSESFAKNYLFYHLNLFNENKDNQFKKEYLKKTGIELKDKIIKR